MLVSILATSLMSVAVPQEVAGWDVTFIGSGRGGDSCSGGGSMGPQPGPSSSDPPAPEEPTSPSSGPYTRYTGPSSPSTPRGGLSPGGRCTTPTAPTSPGSPPRAAAFGAPMTLPSAESFLLDLEGWDHWWLMNKEDFLDPVSNPLPTTPDGTTVGKARGDVIPRGNLPDSLVFERVEPALRAALDDAPPSALTGALLLALARVGEPENGALGDSRLLSTLVRHLDESNRNVAESACVALGVLGRPAVLPVLSAILGDTDRGRKLVDRGEVPLRMRAFAAYGIGLVGGRTSNQDVRDYATHLLVEGLEAEPGAAPDDRVACVIALGMIDAEARRTRDGDCPCRSNDSLARRLAVILNDARDDELVRAHVPATLARIAAGGSERLREEVGELLLARAEKKRERELVRLGAILALGRLADADEDPLDEKIRKRLASIASRGNRSEQSYAAIALARAGARLGDGEGAPDAGTEEVGELLLDELARGRSHERAWSALALGVLGHGTQTAGLPVPAEISEALLHGLRDERSPEQVGAHAVAVGLCRADDSVARLTKKLDTGDENTRALVALALGMSGSTDAVEPLRALVADSSHRPGVLESSARALALLGDVELEPALESLLDECDCDLTRQGVAVALGRTRDPRAVEPLVGMLEDESAPDRQRAWAAIGLGLLAEKDERQWSSRISIGAHYRANPASLTGASRGGILDLP